jgi:hypothetical protein
MSNTNEPYLDVVREEIYLLRLKITARDRRLKLIHDWMNAGTGKVWELFCHEHPVAADWFDTNGMPR